MMSVMYATMPDVYAMTLVKYKMLSDEYEMMLGDVRNDVKYGMM